MSLPRDDAAVLSAQWIEGVLLKRDVFSTVERGRFRLRDGEVDAVLRRLDQVPWWSFIPARHLFARERRALALARDLHVGPELLWAGQQALVRGSSTAWRCTSPSRQATSPISVPPNWRCASGIAPASAITISPKSRTGCAAAMAAPTSRTFSSRPASRPAAGCSASR